MGFVLAQLYVLGVNSLTRLASLSVNFFGLLEVRIRPDPVDGLFLTSDEFGKLNLKPSFKQGTDANARICINARR